jgi:hypothetical protein
MGLPKGKTNNPEGRPKGSLNKTTAEIKELINEFISGNMEDLQSNYDQLDPKDKLQFVRDLLKFVIPTQQAQALNINSLSESELDLLIERITDNLKK